MSYNSSNLDVSAEKKRRSKKWHLVSKTAKKAIYWWKC